MKTFNYTNSAIQYAGRWFDAGNGMGSGWQGAQARFKLSGSSKLEVSAIVVDSTSSDLTMAVINIDGGESITKYFTTEPGTGSGLRTVSFDMPDLGQHTIVLKLGCLPLSQWSGASVCRLASIQIDDTGSLLPWDDAGKVVVQVVGDSWMATQNDWPHLLDPEKYAVYPVSFGGAKASDLAAKYGYARSGVATGVEPHPDMVIIGSGVNDYVGGVSGASFQSSITSLVDQVQAAHPDCLVVLLGCPRNTAAGKTYDQYFSQMLAVAQARGGVVAIEVPSSIWPLFQWSSDTFHLTYTGLKSFADFVSSQLPEIRKLSVGGGVSLLAVEALVSDAATTPCAYIDGALYKLLSRLDPAHSQDHTVYLKLPSGIHRISSAG